MRPARIACLAVALLAAAPPAPAADLRVVVRDARRKPVADAVVTLALTAVPAHAPLAPPAPATHVVDQRDEAFVPYVAVFRPGDRVVFRNSDATRHHVYSFSKAKAFEQLLKPGETGAPLPLEQEGVIAVGCNIHDHMRAWLVVTTAPWVAVTDADGVARFARLPAGPYRSVVWHPQLRPRQPDVAQTLVLADDAAVRELPVSLTLLPDPRVSDPHHANY
jgi:plastocyanin